MNYKNFNKYIVRSPLFPLNTFFHLFGSEETDYNKIIEFIKKTEIQEAFFIASPDLFYEIQKLLNESNEIKEKDKDKLIKTIIKYISRLSCRSTPFGLFAGCGIGTFNKSNQIVLDESKKRRTTRLDMNFLVNLVTKVAKSDKIKVQLKYYPNTTLFELDKNYRYIEYFLEKNKRTHQTVSTEINYYLKKTIKLAKDGAPYKKLIENLKKFDIADEIAVNYINDLIENQILISELEPTVSSFDYLNDIINILKEKKNVDFILDSLITIKNKLLQLDSNYNNLIKDYNQIIEIIDTLDVSYNINTLFQVDVNLGFNKNTLDENIIKKLNNSFSFLEIIDNEKTNDKNINEFKTKFINRYGDEEIPLNLALDNELGIEYGIKPQIVNDLISDIVIEQKTEKLHILENSTYSPFLNKKILDAIENKATRIEITDSDLIHFNKIQKKLPHTISGFIQIIPVDKKIKIKLNSLGGSSAANLLARFCTSNTDIYKYVQEIIDKENYLENKTIAEVVHLPESRVGNILMRPNLRKYEIPYLAKSNLNQENQILTSDIYIKIKNNKIVLFSKKLKKEIIPRLTNAHNFHNTLLPVYKFLCDMQNYERKNHLSFNLGNIIKNYKYIPRIEYKDIIFSEATWILNKEEFTFLNESDDEKIKLFKILKKTRKIPDFVLLIEGDNKLLLNLKNKDFIFILLEKIKKYEITILTEFLFEKDCFIEDKKNNLYTNEFIISFFNDEQKN
ncbi:hypothetical protein FIA58_018585 [Flavobacterium jejuense]|uniref:Lantibiotic dehydratase N-terminal domain-containing protein n=1 Tax=Flavobacterium jejuense TaxID=1544455 RepID=A0ABX0IW55_9FLAO|nr:lantibiotic dehydratase family protein [Flavobacterium jejuense]NHN27693.1 hypothetical protein [Flavobacterium jejuense]